MKDESHDLKHPVAVRHGDAITSEADVVRAAAVQESIFLGRTKPMKTGRPKLPNGAAKGRVVHVRFTSEEIERVIAAAKDSNKTISEWIRSTVNAATES